MQLGPYRLERRLGEGAMGVVHQARHVISGLAVALKTVAVPREGHLAGLRREIHALSRLGHPGIVRIVEHGVQDGLPWYAMEVVEGVPLSGLPRAEALSALRLLCAPLGYLHGEGSVHRDLKPANVLVRPSGFPVLVDFGLTGWFGGVGRDGLDMAGGAAGTLAYLSPEALAGDWVDARADLYALGVMLYEVLTGRLPFACSTLGELARRQREPAAPPSTHAAEAAPFDAVTLRLLEREPGKRLGHADDVAAALAALCPGAGWPAAAPAHGVLYRPSFVGRAEALAELDLRGVTLIGGESGAGKTRLALEAARRVEARRGHVLTGECVAGGGGALEPLRRPLLAVADRAREWGPAEAARLLGDRAARLLPYQPALAALAPGGPEPLGPRADQQLLEDLTRTLAALAEDAPVLLVLDDLQWADPLTLGLIAHLAAAGVPDLGLIGTYRSDEVGPALAALLAGPVRRIALGRLDEAAVGAMSAAMLGQPAAPSFARALAERSEGNPFFVAEYLRGAVAEGLLRREQGAWHLDEAGQLAVPGSLRALVDRRLDQLSPLAQEVAGLAAVLGRELELAILSALAPALDVDSALDELIRQKTIEDGGPGKLRFAHDQLREGAYLRVPAERRIALHAAAARALSAPPHRTRAALPLIAGHLERAGDASALPIWREAADLARRAGAYLEALSLTERALSSPLGSLADRLDLRALRMGQLILLGRYDEVDPELARSLDQLEAASPGTQVEILTTGAHLASLRGRAADAVPFAQRALAAVPPGEPRRAFAAANNFAQALAQMLDFEGALRHLEIALEHAQEVGPDFVVSALNNLGVVRRQLGDIAGARAVLERAVDAARPLGRHTNLASVLGNLASLHAANGDAVQAEELGGQALAIAETAGVASVAANARVTLADAARQQGDFEKAEALASRALAETPKPVTRGAALRVLGLIAAARGDRAAADRHFAASADTLRPTGERDRLAETLAAWGNALGDDPRAEGLLAEAEATYRAAGLPLRAVRVRVR